MPTISLSPDLQRPGSAPPVQNGAMTHGPELMAPVDHCAPDGATLNPAALGWSRHPMHRPNLAGSFGINKRCD
jgi:hypothetical protein